MVHGPAVSSVFEVKESADRAQAGLRAAAAWPQAPHPVYSEDLWPERAISGDPLALRSTSTGILRVTNFGGRGAGTTPVYQSNVAVDGSSVEEGVTSARRVGGAVIR